MDSLISRLYESLRSLKLAFVLIVILALLAAIGGIIPQNAQEDFYTSNFNSLTSSIIVRLSLDRVFTSTLFLLVAAVFSLNLTICTVHRLSGQFIVPWQKRRHGPDILHIGLILLIIGGTWSARTNTQTSFTLGVGDEVVLPGGQLLRLKDFVFGRYPDGRPSLWNSQIDIDDSGETKIRDFNLRVNHPLRFRGYTLYQSGYGTSPVVALTKQAVDETYMVTTSLGLGERIATDDGFVLLMAQEPSDVEGQSRYVFLLEDNTGRKVKTVGIGESIGPLTLLEAETVYHSSIQVRRDPAYLVVLAGLILVLLGTLLTYLLKLRELAK
ncbi:MAG: cytochrome c biogenesis protein ResB [Spirochaetota bacterium]